jgi:Rrf2 family protein
MRISHKVAYALRVTTTLAQLTAENGGRPVAGAVLAATDELPTSFLPDILQLLRKGGILQSRRGGQGGWLLARPGSKITVADVIRAVEGPLASVRGIPPHELAGTDEDEAFVTLWIAVRASLRAVLEAVTIDHLARGQLPKRVVAMAEKPDSWDDRRPARLA